MQRGAIAPATSERSGCIPSVTGSWIIRSVLRGTEEVPLTYCHFAPILFFGCWTVVGDETDDVCIVKKKGFVGSVGRLLSLGVGIGVREPSEKLFAHTVSQEELCPVHKACALIAICRCERCIRVVKNRIRVNRPSN